MKLCGGHGRTRQTRTHSDVGCGSENVAGGLIATPHMEVGIDTMPDVMLCARSTPVGPRLPGQAGDRGQFRAALEVGSFVGDWSEAGREGPKRHAKWRSLMIFPTSSAQPCRQQWQTASMAPFRKLRHHACHWQPAADVAR